MRCSALLGAIFCLAACSRGAPGPGIDVGRALRHVEALVALGPRPHGSDASRAAAAYLEAQLTGLGAAVARVPVGATTDPNLVVRFGPDRGRALLIMAHYDTVPQSPGAVDNAAACAVLIELARALANAPPPIPVILAFTAGEEVGLIGAESLAANLDGRVAFAVALDLIGGSGALTLNGASRQIGRAELGWIARAADRAGVAVDAPTVHRVVSRTWPELERADHGAFTRRGVPAVHLYHRGQDGELIDLAYHSMRDTASRVERGSLDDIGRLLRVLTVELPPAYAGDGFWLPRSPHTVVWRGWLVAFDVLFAALALGLLVTLRTTRARGGLGLLAGAACFVLAALATIAVERLAARGHLAPWVHAPGSAVLAELAIFIAAFWGATRLAQRLAPWRGDRRYLAIGIALPLSLGLGCALMGAAELAWIWFVPAASCALAPRLGRLRWLAVALSGLPGVLVLSPDLLREAIWHGFLPPSVPLAAWIAAFALAPLATLAWALRTRSPPGPLGSLVLHVGGGLAMLVGLARLLLAEPACKPAEFKRLGLTCEAATRVH